ncbi:hypothetical protein C8T65DRAFT_711460 [Cerioporus squamosus]|nr:hypothetical protein C8T65DRAFT_711460 [Cerioporus squamosus]
MDYVPSPQIGIVQVSLRSDYHYGVVDPIQWLQVHMKEFDYLCASDFELLEGSLFTCLGLLKRDALRPLDDLVDELSASVISMADPPSSLALLHLAMTQAQERLKYFPCTFRDACLQVRETQRYWLMSQACMEFNNTYVPAFVGSPQPVQRQLMGAFTTNPGEVQNLFNAGIPVWFIRSDVSILQDTRTAASIILEPLFEICMDAGPVGRIVVYSGLVGAEHITQTVRFGQTYLNLSRAPLLVVDTEGGYPSQFSARNYKGILVGGQSATAPTTSTTPVLTSAQDAWPHGTQVRGVNKFEHLEHAWMPAELSTWQDAFRSVDLSKPTRPDTEVWGYWIPEPALLLCPKTEDRRDRYIMTWLRLRAGWLYLLHLPDVPVTSVPTQWWRDILYGPTGRTELDPSKLNTRCWEEIKKVFGTVFQEADLDSNQSDPVWWCGHRFRAVDPELCPKIIWEMFDLGFRYELLALDRLFVPSRKDLHGERKRVDMLAAIFPGHHLFSIPELPDAGVGLSARVPHHRVPYLEAFRRVVSRWPSCPTSLHDSTPFATTMSNEEIIAREKVLVKYYVDTFFAQSGRAPIVPHEYP